ncbi:hypothetical protein [Arthrobacter sp. SX1312]|uniref:hypothetical protein n=1 Tax=Arthrobacter sp. SX1312 TaxID=2058896 RepID=UPI000CE54883|nr:hypothetical protein [Arthrobacter sp. SX1312]
MERVYVASVCEAVATTIDMRAMLGRVIPEVFDEHLVTADANTDHKIWPYGSLVESRMSEGRSVIIGADGGPFMIAYVPELSVQTMVFDEEDDEEDAEVYREEALRKLCLVMLVYLEGGGRISERRSPLGRGIVRKLIIESDGFDWRLARNFSSGPKPL